MVFPLESSVKVLNFPLMAILELATLWYVCTRSKPTCLRVHKEIIETLLRGYPHHEIGASCFETLLGCYVF